VNVLEAGGDYGWPVASEACNYGTDDPVGVSHADREGVTAPVHVWPCGGDGFPPSGATIYDGDAFPSWRGDLFAGNLAGQYLGRLSIDGRAVDERAPLLADQGWRVRAVADDPAGRLYVAIDAESAPLVRLSPA
ncbi:glucose dehydrogenase, partial [Halobacteriales archaeon QS_8_69_73]